MAVQDGLGKEVNKLLLHESLDRTGTVLRFIAFRAHIVLEAFRELDRDPVFRELCLKIGYLHLQYLTDVGLRQRFEHYHFIDSVQEFRTDSPLEHFQHFIAAFSQHFRA